MSQARDRIHKANPFTAEELQMPPGFAAQWQLWQRDLRHRGGTTPLFKMGWEKGCMERNTCRHFTFGGELQRRNNCQLKLQERTIGDREWDRHELFFCMDWWERAVDCFCPVSSVRMAPQHRHCWRGQWVPKEQNHKWLAVFDFSCGSLLALRAHVSS